MCERCRHLETLLLLALPSVERISELHHFLEGYKEPLTIDALLATIKHEVCQLERKN